MENKILLLKHYLGNDVQVYNTDTQRMYNLVVMNNTVSIRGGITLSDLINEPKVYIPCLRPMSDLIKPFFYLNDEIDMRVDFPNHEIVFKELSELNDSHFKKYIKWQVMELLFEFHFDVFGLIKEGLAYDINEIVAKIAA